jgi:hypothetical protein
MTAPAPPQTAGASAALMSVLRQVGPRALVFAELLCGRREPAEAAMQAAVLALGQDLARAPVIDWTQRFWVLLVAAPSLRRPQPDPHWPSDLAALAGMGTGVRAAVLLRTVARLDDAAAAAVLGIPVGRYLDALRHGLPRHADGRVDVAAWRGLLSACEQAVRSGPEPRAGRLDRLFALATRPESTPRGSPPAWLRPVLWCAGGACLLALAGTWVGHRRGAGSEASAQALPAAATPASTFDATTAVLTHPDFDAAADAHEQALVGNLGFYAWYAARIAGAAGAAPLVLPDAAAPASDVTDHAQAPGAAR